MYAPANLQNIASAPNARTWSNVRGYGDIVFDRCAQSRQVVHPGSKLERLVETAEAPAVYLNESANITNYGAAVAPLMSASCRPAASGRDPAPRLECGVPPIQTLDVQQQMFADVPYDSCPAKND